MNDKKLLRSAKDRKICGVCGGLGTYLGVDSNIVRLVWALLALSGIGVALYVIAALILPSEPYDYY